MCDPGPDDSLSLQRSPATPRTVGGLIGVVLLASCSSMAGAERLVDLAGEALRASDIKTTEVSLLGRRSEHRAQWTASLVHGRIVVDYAPAPVDLLGHPKVRTESRLAPRVAGRLALSDDTHVTVAAGAYRGFTDFRSVWLDEYYRQLFEGMDGYRAAHPQGFDGSVAGRWEYLGGSGFVTAVIKVQRDEISPGYEKLPFEPLRRGRSWLTTWSAGLSSEHVLNRSMRLKQDFEAIDTTGRSWRFRYAAEHAWAIAERWVVRDRLEASKEGSFHGVSMAVSFERDWSDTWFLGVNARVYRDNGQIIDPDLISGASPGLDTLLAYAALRYSGPRGSASLAIGPYRTRYDPLAPGTQRFARLYRDRDWIWAQAIWSTRF